MPANYLLSVKSLQVRANFHESASRPQSVILRKWIAGGLHSKTDLLCGLCQKSVIRADPSPRNAERADQIGFSRATRRQVKPYAEYQSSAMKSSVPEQTAFVAPLRQFRDLLTNRGLPESKMLRGEAWRCGSRNCLEPKSFQGCIL